MKILVVGAGAIGGFIAARMLEAELDVTLFIREGRKQVLAEKGLLVKSPTGDYCGHPPLLVSGEAGGPFDLVVIATKSYGLPEVLTQLKPYTHAKTALLPFLNGMKHMEQISEAYPGHPLLGGVARIEITLGKDGVIQHLSSHHLFTYGVFRNMDSQEYEAIRTLLSRVPILVENADIARDLWEKYAFINVLSGLTTLFQATVGEIRDTTDGMDTFKRAFTETDEVIRAAGGTLSDGLIEKQLKIIRGLSSESTSSMLRDLRQQLPIESAHIQGYLVELASRHNCDTPLLKVIHQKLEIYEKTLKIR